MQHLNAKICISCLHKGPWQKTESSSSYFGLTEIVMIIIENIRVTSLAIELLSMLALFKQFLKYYM